jgi:cytochrome c biogenesis factor
MQRSSLIIAAVLILAGGTFTLQGLGVIRSSSFMTDDLRWTWIGGAMVVAGVGLVWLTRRRPA